MDKQRAKKISATPVMANVTFNGTQIYINNVDEKNDTATVYPLEQPQKIQKVF
ncbi:MAG: spore protein H [Clostridiaceae bacterium BRH_c20a]|nr:MAG: spore protein H [Clostridiaceae bacterium BRH_c20a]